MASTKLIVLKAKEIIYTVIFLALVAVLVIILMIMFKDDDKKEDDKLNPVTSEVQMGYVPGTYESSITLGESSIAVMVTVDEESITDVSFKQTDESVMAMYPLLESSLEDINTQLQYVNSIDNLTYSSDNKYTSTLIINSIRDALSKAIVQ